uniref:alpha-1,6-mannosyl-glycoprotein 4-beta-N-acetylglucosaminyltransferase-like n=1 Tax=Pristiophorus japonicus TaxID=55135 RepID=UPI00398ECD05
MKWRLFARCIRCRNLPWLILLLAAILALHYRADIHCSRDLAWNEQNNSGDTGRTCNHRWRNSTAGIEVSQPLNISYLYLAGTLPKNKKYLSIGISSIRRVRGSYLMDTLRSVFEKSSPEELQQMVVVIYLAEFDVSWSTRTAAEIEARFAPHISAGRLLIIRCPRDIYPTLEGLKRNYNDPMERVRFRSKQNVDYAFLVNFCADLSEYYLMLEDDVMCARNFLSSLRRSVSSAEGSPWATLTFSKLGYIGKLYHSADLPQLARFLLMFYDEMPCDWLLGLFRRAKAQPEEVRFRPSLFQHTGTFSSFKGTHNQLRDDEFQEWLGGLPDNPPASAFSDIRVHQRHSPARAYGLGGGQFWGKSPRKGNYFLLVFERPVEVAKIGVHTGSPEHQGDILHSGILQLGRGKAQGDGHQTCQSYSPLGTFTAGRFEMQNIAAHISQPIECVRVLVTEDQKDWLIISEVNIWIEKGQ